MFGFIKYMWKEYRKQSRIEVLKNKLQEMVSDVKLKGVDMRSKYGNPSAVFARTKWEIYQIKRGLK